MVSLIELRISLLFEQAFLNQGIILLLRSKINNILLVENSLFSGRLENQNLAA